MDRYKISYREERPEAEVGGRYRGGRKFLRHGGERAEKPLTLVLERRLHVVWIEIVAACRRISYF